MSVTPTPPVSERQRWRVLNTTAQAWGLKHQRPWQRRPLWEAPLPAFSVTQWLGWSISY